MPNQTEVRVTYSTGVKCNIGNYESADAHLSHGETWDVSDLATQEDVDAFVKTRAAAIREALVEAVNQEYKDLKS